jgi:iron complex transport system substrate-binding protein
MVAVACTKAAPPAAPSRTTLAPTAIPVTLTDDDGVAVTMTRPPHRIVTWAPSNTEILFALGLGPTVVGVSGAFDNYPLAARSIAHVAGQGGVTPDVEKIVSLRADLVLNGFAGGDDWKKRVRDLGIPVFSIYASTLDDALHDIETVGELTGTPARAAAVTASMSTSMAEAVAPYAGQPPVTCFFEAYYPPLTSVGPHTFIFDVLRRAGCSPVSSSAKSDYPAWSVERLVQDSPAVYLAASESATSTAAVGKRPGFFGIAAVAAGQVFLVDSDLITRPGPRVVDALAAVARDLHHQGG